MLINEITNSGAIPSLEMSLRFAGARQRLLAHNIANISTPDFRPMDVDPAHFAQVLRGAIEERRARTGHERGELPGMASKQIGMGCHGELRLTPRTPSGNILFHDRNNRDLERLMQDNSENVAAFRLSSELLRSRFEMLRSAIAERA
jgi:flagellar basal-body rod protein FlgB